MNLRSIVAIAALLFLSACAVTSKERFAVRDVLALAGEPVTKVRFAYIDRWRPIDDLHIVIWFKRNEPYLVRLDFPVFDIDRAQTISTSGFSSQEFRVKSDYIVISGERFRAQWIRPLPRRVFDQLRAGQQGAAEGGSIEDTKI